MIKCDAEGAELRILKGGEKAIKKYKPLLLLEIEHDNIGLNYLYEFGYEPYYVKNNKFIDAEKIEGGIKDLTILIHKEITNKYVHVFK